MYNALTEGDLITISHNHRRYRLRVNALRPAAAVSLIDTDLVVDFDEPSSAAPHTRRTPASDLTSPSSTLPTTAAEETQEQDSTHTPLPLCLSFLLCLSVCLL